MFTGFECRLPGADATYSVDFYPWWEHPACRAAIERGEQWNADMEKGARTVTVHARTVLDLKVAPREEVIDWAFTQEHPLLWAYEEESDLLCNDALPLETLLETAYAVSQGFGPHT